MKGTPKTLIQALVNGLEDMGLNDEDAKKIAKHQAVHVIDFLAQKFSIANLKESVTIKDLWQMVTKQNSRRKR